MTSDARDVAQIVKLPDVELLQLSQDWIRNQDAAVAASTAALVRFPDFMIDFMFNIALISAHISHQKILRGVLPDPHPLPTDNDFPLRIPPTLKNGLVNVARLVRGVRRDRVAAHIEERRAAEADLLVPIFARIQQEVDGLVVDKLTPAQREGLSREEAMRDAADYFKAFQSKDYEAALRGFSHLKRMNPFEAYFRNMLGATYDQLQKPEEALREYLYAFACDSHHEHAITNLVRSLTTYGLYASALEVWNHHVAAVGRDKVKIEERTQKLIALSRAYVSGLACALAEARADDVSASSGDLMDTLAPLPRPWLHIAPPPEAGPRSILEGKRVVISYRRTDAKLAEQLRFELKLLHPSLKVFRDEMDLSGGESFTERLRKEIEQAQVLLVLITPIWASREGLQRLGERADVVRREIAWAIDKDVPLLPLLVDSAGMPAAEQLPTDLRLLPRTHAEQLRTRAIKDDVGRISSAMVQIVAYMQAREKKSAEWRKRADEIREKDGPEGFFEEFKADIEAWKKTLRRFVSVKAEKGQGVPASQVEMIGTWNCLIKGPTVHSRLQLVIDGKSGSNFEGLLEFLDANGGPTGSQKIEGNWATVEDSDAKLVLGLQIEFIRDGKPGGLEIPFHRRIGPDFVGTDVHGANYTSRNVDPRPGGF